MLPCVVVHPASGHDAEDLLDQLRVHGTFSGERVDAAVGERRRHDAQVAAVHRHGALAEVQIQRQLGVFDDDVEVSQHVPDGAIAVSGRPFRSVYVVIDLEPPAGVERIHGD
jgi:hypothetical protein